jgi:hypothetical protein
MVGCDVTDVTETELMVSLDKVVLCMMPTYIVIVAYLVLLVELLLRKMVVYH